MIIYQRVFIHLIWPRPKNMNKKQKRNNAHEYISKHNRTTTKNDNAHVMGGRKRNKR